MRAGLARWGLALATAAGGVSAASAADFGMADTPAPAMATVPGWTGFYAGLQAGYSIVVAEDDYDPSYHTPYYPNEDYGGEGATAGIFAGYDLHLGSRFVAGIEASANLRNVVSQYDADNYDNYFVSRWSAGVRGRAGVLLSPSTLLYGSAGWQWARFEYNDYGEVGAYGNREHVANGPQFGGGVETVLANGVIARLDATYTRYGSEAISYLGAPYYYVVPDEFAVQLGFGYHFGGRTAAPAADSAPLDWAGFYAGLQAGGSASDAYQTLAISSSDPWAEFAAVAPGAGAFAGFNAKLADRFVVGLEGAANLRDLLAQFQGSLYDHLYESRWSASLRGRAGVLINPDTLVYGSFGWQWADIDFSSFYASPTYAPNAGTIDGPQIGGGVETAIGSHLTLRADATFTWYGGFGIDELGSPNTHYSLRELTGMVGLAYHP